MFGVKKLRERLDNEVGGLHKRVNSLDAMTASALSNDRCASDKAVRELRIDVMNEVRETRSLVYALAAALGYEWVPEGKTEATWRKKADAIGRLVWENIPISGGERFVFSTRKVARKKKGGRK